MSALEDVFARARPIAEAVLWEGYLLYPYRASSAKNRVRFQWGVVGPAETRTLASTVLVERRARTIDVRLRFLHLQEREDGWDEAIVVERTISARLEGLLRAAVVAPIDLPEASTVGADGKHRTRWPITGSFELSAIPADEHGDYIAVTALVENTTECAPAERSHELRVSFAGCHMLFASPDDVFVSLLDPPPAAAEAAARCAQHRAWPVMVGPQPRRDLVLATPVILYDYPSIAPESRGDFFDGTEIDELLTLRVLTLTDAEKQEARALDERARAVIDRCDASGAADLAALHGTIRELTAHPDDPVPEWSDPGLDAVVVGENWVTAGDKVRLRPSRRADVHDMFLDGLIATVARVVNDVDGNTHVAITIDDDPAADLMNAHGRYRYFAPDELEIVEASHG
jgi:hypothetical protein